MKSLLITLVSILVLSFSSYTQNSESLSVGDKAPLFKTLADDGNKWNVKDHIGEKYVVVYFYPAAMTGGCTKQACAYRDMSTEIDELDAIVVGISGDNVEGLKLFKQAENLNFTLLSDESGEIAKMYGVPLRDGGQITREVDGQSYDLVRGVTSSRWTFIIDKNGKIAYKDEQVNASNDSKQVLDFIRNN